MASEQPAIQRTIQRSRTPFWRDDRVLRIAAQVVSAILIVGFLYWGIDNLIRAAEQRGLSLGFGFLGQAAGFPIGEGSIPYDPARSFAYAFLVGLINTLKVSAAGILLTTLIGLLVGIARLSSNWLVNRMAVAYIEIHRNIPLLVLLYLWYSGVFIQLPRVRDSLEWPGPIFINQRGVFMAWPRLTETGWIFLIFSLGGVVLMIAAWILSRRLREKTSHARRLTLVGLAALVALPVLGWMVAGGTPLTLEVPELQGFNFRGGLQLTPEFTALLVGLVTYTAAFVAEVVRAGIQSVQHGQVEAARALGLSPSRILTMVVFPQALRVIIPPLINQYLNLIKNSSLAVFIGYPELFFIGKTTTNQAGRAVQVILLVMLVYLVISLVTSTAMNLYNRRIQLVER